MQSALASVDGVETVTIDFDAKTAVIRCPDGDCDTEALVAAVEEAGFQATVQE